MIKQTAGSGWVLAWYAQGAGLFSKEMSGGGVVTH